MDPLTQAALGATVGLAGFRRRLGRRAMAVGAVVGALPDVDVVVGWTQGPIAEWLYHRGVTHSIPFAAVAGPLLGWAAWRLLRRGDEGAAPWMGLCTAALITHPVIDLITHYGTQLLAPFSTWRFGLPAMPVIDPLFTLMLLAAIGVGAFSRRLGVAAGWAALIACYAYAMWAWSLNGAVEAEARRQLAAAGQEAVEVRAYPTIFQPYLRRVVVRADDMVLVGFLSVLNPRPIAWSAAEAVPAAEAARLAGAREAAVLRWFADDQVLVRRRADGSLEMSDLRYGLPVPGAEFGIWGVRAAPDGSVQVYKERPGVTGERLAELWRLVFG